MCILVKVMWSYHPHPCYWNILKYDYLTHLKLDYTLLFGQYWYFGMNPINVLFWNKINFIITNNCDEYNESRWWICQQLWKFLMMSLSVIFIKWYVSCLPRFYKIKPYQNTCTC